jgi:hypothetical protein
MSWRVHPTFHRTIWNKLLHAPYKLLCNMHDFGKACWFIIYTLCKMQQLPVWFSIEDTVVSWVPHRINVLTPFSFSHLVTVRHPLYSFSPSADCFRGEAWMRVHKNIYMTINVYTSSIHTYIQHICVHRHSIPRRLDPYDFIAFSCFGADKVSVTLLKRHKVSWLLAIHPSTAAVCMYRTVLLPGRNSTESTERPSARAQAWLIPRD